MVASSGHPVQQGNTDIMHPQLTVQTEEQLITLALHLEQCAADNYRGMAADMDRHDNPETAALFRRLAEEEQSHHSAIEAHHAAGRNIETVYWEVPVELTTMELPGDPFLLTPYAAICFALHNEEKTFSLFTTLSAFAEEPGIRALADRFAQEELTHMAQLRLARRSASRELADQRDRLSWWCAKGEVLTDRHLARMDADLAAGYDAAASRLHELGAAGAAGLLAELATQARQFSQDRAGGPMAETPPDLASQTDPGEILLCLLRQTDQALEFVTLQAQTCKSDLMLQTLSAIANRLVQQLHKIRSALAASTRFS